MPTGFTFPPDYDPQKCAVVFIPVALMPFIAGAVAGLRERPYWDTSADWISAYSAFTQVEAYLMQHCAEDFTKGIDRLYMLLDSALYGHTYNASGEPLVITPPIPDVPDTASLPEGLVDRARRLFEMLDNSINGSIYIDFSDENSIKARLQAINDAILADDEIEAEQLQELIQILAALA